MRKVEMFGDSILRGVMYDGTRKKYCLCGDRAFADLQSRGLEVRNHAKMGATIEDGLARVQRVLPEGTDASDTTVLLEFGGNDCDYRWDEVAEDPTGSFLPNLPSEKFLEQYRKAIRWAKARGARVALTSLVPINASRYFEWISRGRNASNILRWLGDKSMLYRWQEQYSRLVERLSFEMDCPMIDERDAFLKSHQFTDLLCEDGIHPTQAGHDLFRRTIADFCLGE